MRWLVLVLALAACGKNEAAAPDVEAAERVTRNGRIRVGDKFESIVPEVIHEAKMDLFVGCKAIVEQAKTDGHENVPLCYEPKARARDTVKVIRVEQRLGGTADAMRHMAENMESTHFIVEPFGSRFQLLDLAYAERREGSNRADEIRILAVGGKDIRGAAEQAATLAQALRELYPQAKIETLDVQAASKP